MSERNKVINPAPTSTLKFIINVTINNSSYFIEKLTLFGSFIIR